MEIGEQAMLGWNAAKALGCEGRSGENVRLEASGHDWLVFRDEFGRAHAIDFESCTDKFTYLREINK